MNKKNDEQPQNPSTLAEDAQALIAATANVAGEEIAEARKRLSAALGNNAQLFTRVEEKVLHGAKCTDKAVREHPYQALGIAVGVGVLLGYLAACRCSGKKA